MKKFWRVMIYEYTRHVLRKRFLFGLVSLPILMAFMAVIVLWMARSANDNRPLGYVDHSGLLTNPVQYSAPGPSGQLLEIIPFTTEEQAQKMLEIESIQAYYVLNPDYPVTRAVKLVSLKQPGISMQAQFKAFIRANLLAGQPPAIARRLTEGSELVVHSSDGRRQMGESDWGNVFFPFFTGFAFMIAIFTVSGYLMQAVIEEKENRIIEVLITSVSPLQLIGGKVIGIIAVGFTQLLAWLGLAMLVLLISRNSVAIFSDLHIPPGLVELMFLVMLPSFVMLSALMAAVGATVSEAREGQQIAALFTTPVVLPYWFIATIMSNPGGPLAVALSFFPLTAPVTLVLRAAFTLIPTWQLALNVVVLVACSLAAIWLAGRTFRLGMLQYGQPLTWRQVFGKSV